MSRGINRVHVLGFMGGPPEQRATGSGTMVTNLRVATTETWKDKQTGEKCENTEWHRVSLFGRLAEVAAQYTQKGTQVYVEGSLRTSKYTDKDGIERYSTDIVGRELQIVSGGRFEDRGDGEGERPRPHAGESQGRQERSSPREPARPPQNGRGDAGHAYRNGNGGGQGHGAQRQAPPPREPAYEPRGGGADFGTADDDIPFRGALNRRNWAWR